MTAELRMRVVEWLRNQGIKARPFVSCIAVSRDSMCNSKFKMDGIPEEGTYPAVLDAIQVEFPKLMSKSFYWVGKTDEDLFLDTLG